jgi:hypothetical protein
VGGAAAAAGDDPEPEPNAPAAMTAALDKAERRVSSLMRLSLDVLEGGI